MIESIPESISLRTIASQPCSRCGGIYYQGSKTCDTCGIVISKYEEVRSGPSVFGGVRLERAWQKVIDSYYNEEVHEEFIRRSLGENNLAFAAQKYRWMLEANPADETAMRMRSKCIQVAGLQYVPAARPVLERRTTWDLTSMFIGAGSGMIVAGFMMPYFRQGFLGVGILLITLTLIQRTFGYTSPRS